MVNRRNGDRRLFVLKDENRLEKVNVPAMGRQIVAPFRPITLAHVDTFALTIMRCLDTGPWMQVVHQQSLVLCYDGRLTIDTEEEQVSLGDAELVVVPNGTRHQLSSEEGALVLGVQRHQSPDLS
jgi:hypothetical protein